MMQPRESIKIHIVLCDGEAGGRDWRDAELHQDGHIWTLNTSDTTGQPLAHVAQVQICVDRDEAIKGFPGAPLTLYLMCEADRELLTLVAQAYSEIGATDALLSELAVALKVVEHSNAELRSLVEAVKQSDAYRRVEADLSQVREHAARIDRALRARAILHFRTFGNKRVNNALRVREETTLRYDEEEAVRWARENLPEAFSFNPEIFKRYVLSMASIKPVSFVRIEHLPVGTISQKHLARYMPTEQGAAPPASMTHIGEVIKRT